MSYTLQGADFSVGQKVLHWLIAIAIIFDLFVAQKFGGVMMEADRFESRSDHASLGTVVAVLFALRLYLRLKHGAPALPADLPGWQKQIAHLVHWVLYGLIGLLILSGIGSAITANSSVAPFGLFAYGDGIGNAATFDLIRSVHEVATKAIIALIVLHIAAALYHLVSKHRALTLRMMMFWRSAGQVR